MDLKRKIIIPTGYMGSGSSVITDLMSEMDGIDTTSGTFEFVFLHCPNGVFDLEDKLLIGNNAVRSDEALLSFERTMKELYDKKYWWVGNYKKYFGEGFLKATKEYLEALTDLESEYFWYYQENTTPKMFFHLCFQKAIKILTFGKAKLKKVLEHEPMRLSFAEPEEFYEASRRYISNVLDMVGKKDQSIVFDQLLLPFNLFRFEHYFDENAHVFVIERDPRDVFISNKYYWAKNGGVVPYPRDVKAFCTYYKKLRTMERDATSKQIHRIKFEDLIYRYDETVKMIIDSLGLDENQHIRKKTQFIPKKSIFNTQLYRKSEAYQEECGVIAEELSEYLYDFPYPIDHKSGVVF